MGTDKPITPSNPHPFLQPLESVQRFISRDPDVGLPVMKSRLKKKFINGEMLRPLRP
jgi:hypothetical protein